MTARPAPPPQLVEAPPEVESLLHRDGVAYSELVAALRLHRGKRLLTADGAVLWLAKASNRRDEVIGSIPRAIPLTRRGKTMILPEVRNATIPFGKHKGRTLDAVANAGLDHDGLRYLDWLVGQSWLKTDHPRLLTALRAYLGDPDMARSLELALEER